MLVLKVCAHKDCGCVYDLETNGKRLKIGQKYMFEVQLGYCPEHEDPDENVPEPEEVQ